VPKSRTVRPDETGEEDTDRQVSADKPNYSVPAVEKALDIIEYLAAEGVPMTRV
jgi:hypothetical protein